MNILAVTDNLGNVGGAEISSQTIIKELSYHKEVGEITVIGIEPSDTSQLNFGDARVVPVDLPKRVDDFPALVGDYIIERSLAREIQAREKSVDIIHAHHRRSALALSRVETSSQTIATVRDYWPACPISTYSVDGERCTGCEDHLDSCITHNNLDGYSRIGTKAYLLAKRRHQRQTISSMDCAIFIAGHIRDRLSESVELPPQTEIVYNPVSVADDIEPISLGFPTFVTASSLSKSKGVSAAVEAIETVGKTHSDARLIILGDGPEREKLEELARSHNSGTVEFRGRVSLIEVYRTIAGATATIFPSLWEEPFGRVTVESMMLGTPVVGSNVGGIAEIIDHEKNSLLFPPGDTDALSERLKRIIEDEHLREELAESSKCYSTRFTPKRIVQSHIDIYDSLASK